MIDLANSKELREDQYKKCANINRPRLAQYKE